MTPLALRFSDALNNIAAQSDNPQMAMIIRGLNRHLAKHPMDDGEIASMCQWIKHMVDGVLYGPAAEVEVTAVAPESLTSLSPSEFVTATA